MVARGWRRRGEVGDGHTAQLHLCRTDKCRKSVYSLVPAAENTEKHSHLAESTDLMLSVLTTEQQQQQ